MECQFAPAGVFWTLTGRTTENVVPWFNVLLTPIVPP